MIKQFYLITMLAIVLFCSCSKSGDDGNNSIVDVFVPTLTIQPGTNITEYYNNTASFSWTTNVASVAGVENGVGYYWKNGVRKFLVGVQSSVANTILVTPGPHVYAAGSDYTHKAIYWYDHTFTLLHTSPS
jgi:hypothetical protein